MKLEQIKATLKTSEYDFLRENKKLGNNIMVLTLGGSHAYGLDKEDSDLDIRGIALNSKEEILLGNDFEQIVNVETDTTLYSFNKMIQLLTSNNPNTIEILGCKLEHYPLRDWAGMWNEMKTIVTSYNKIGKRNENAMSHNKLGKHMAHLLRLYMMCIDILEKEEIITYRSAERDLLMRIRNGEYLDANRQPVSDFYDLLNEYEKRFEYAKQNTSLPDVPDYKRINEFKMYVNEKIVKGEV